MAITHRTGPIEEFDPHKMRRGEWAFPYNGEAYYCVSPGNVKRVATKEEIIGILETNQEAYDGLQQLISELEDETVLTGILNDISTLLDDVALNKSNIVSNTQDIVNLDDKVNTHLAEKVHQYEEGVWTPALTFGGGTAGITYGPREGKYTKIGNVVTCYCNFVLTSKGTATGSAEINGLPFPVVGNGAFSFGETFGTTLPSDARDIFGILLTAKIGIRSNNSSNTTIDLTNAHIGNTSRFRFNFTYITQ